MRFACRSFCGLATWTTRWTGASIPTLPFCEFDLEAIFYRQWLFAGLEAEIQKPGDYFTLEVGPTSVIVLRNRNGDIKAFHTTARANCAVARSPARFPQGRCRSFRPAAPRGPASGHAA